MDTSRAIAFVVLVGAVLLIVPGQAQASAKSGGFSTDKSGGKSSGDLIRNQPVIVPGKGGVSVSGSSREIDAIGRTIWGEGAGEGPHGMELIAAVIMNRVAAQAWYGASIIDVIYYPSQFEIWNPGHPRGAQSNAVTTDNDAFRAALDIAARAVSGQLQERAQGATHYHRSDQSADWDNAPNMQRLFTYGNHVFYREVLTA